MTKKHFFSSLLRLSRLNFSSGKRKTDRLKRVLYRQALKSFSIVRDWAYGRFDIFSWPRIRIRRNNAFQSALKFERSHFKVPGPPPHFRNLKSELSNFKSPDCLCQAHLALRSIPSIAAFSRTRQ
jgi:hypothetical protein